MRIAVEALVGVQLKYLKFIIDTSYDIYINQKSGLQSAGNLGTYQLPVKYFLIF